MRVRWIRAAAGYAAAGVLGVSAARGTDCPAIDSPAVSVSASCPAVDRVGKAALRIFLDRRTGRLRAPTPEEARALFESGGVGLESLEPVEILVHENGMRTLDLKGAFSHAVVSHRNPDGSVTTRCVPAGPGADPQ